MTNTKKKNRRIAIMNYEKLKQQVGNINYINENFIDGFNMTVLEQLFKKTSQDLDFSPSCECGLTKSKQFLGHVCGSCLTIVKSNFTSNYYPNNWMKIPEELPSFMHPRLYLILASFASKQVARRLKNSTGKSSKVPVIDMVLDPDLDIHEEIAPGIKGQGMKYFEDNVEEILQYLLLDHPKYSKKPDAQAIYDICKRELDNNNFFLREIPLLHPIFHPMHITGKSRTIDRTADIIIPAIVDLTSTVYANRHFAAGSKHVNRGAWKVFKRYIEYIKKIMEEKLGDKHALLRRHAFASRVHFTGRAVISPITHPHEGDEVHIPWNIGMSVLMFEIINRLCSEHNFRMRDATEMYYSHINKYDPLIDSIIKKLINETINKGLPAILNRNPTLIRESERTVRITKVKTDPTDKTINPSVRICAGFNFDHDGDELNLFLIKEQGYNNFISTAHPKEGILSETSLSVSGWVKPTKETFVHGNNFLRYKQHVTTPYTKILEIPKHIRSENVS